MWAGFGSGATAATRIPGATPEGGRTSGRAALGGANVLQPARNGIGRVLGMDWSARQVAERNGAIHRLSHLQRLETKLCRQQRVSLRKRKGSRRREKQCAHRRLANARRNWRYHVSTRLAAKAETIEFEDLRTRGMTASVRGAADRPGTKVRQKVGPNRAILRTGWAALNRILDFKVAEVIDLPAAYTSQDLRQPRLRGSRFSPLAGKLPMRGLRLCAQRGPERGQQYSGVGTRRNRTARGVANGHS